MTSLIISSEVINRSSISKDKKESRFTSNVNFILIFICCKYTHNISYIDTQNTSIAMILQLFNQVRIQSYRAPVIFTIRYFTT